MAKAAAVPLTREQVFRMLGVVFLTSLSVLVLEIAFTRVLSVLLSYHYVFAVIALSMLGLGAGGIAAHSSRRLSAVSFGPVVSALFSFAILFSVLLVIKMPLPASIVPYSALILVPFFFAGVVLSSVFKRLAAYSGRVYFADLVGAGLGSLLSILLLNVFGGVNTALVASVLAAGAGLLCALNIKREVWLGTANVAISVAVLIVAIAVPRTVAVSLVANPSKDIGRVGHSGQPADFDVVETRWSAFGRTDLVQYAEEPDRMVLFIDATAGAPMYRFSGDIQNPGDEITSLKATFPGFFAFPFLKPEQKEKALIIGPGGGRDVLVALMGGVKDITAVDVNPDFIDLVKEYSDYNGGIYTDLANVKVVAAEGRSFLQQQEGKYDIIMLSLPVTKTSRSPDGFALTENYLFTKESIQQYLDHLTDDGRLVITAHQTLEVIRLITISLAAMEERGIDSRAAMNYIYTVGSGYGSLFVLSKTALTPSESYLEHQAVHLLGLDPEEAYFPNVRLGDNADHVAQKRFDECQMLNSAFVAVSVGLIATQDLERAVARQGFDASVVTDNRPFFYNLEADLIPAVSSVLWLALAAVFVTIAVPAIVGLRNKRKGPLGRSAPTVPFITIFLALGLGFMLVEVALIQKFTLLLGDPMLATAVLLFSLLVGAGLGGLCSGRLSTTGLSRKTGLVCLGIGVVITAYTILVPGVVSGLMGESNLLRAGAAVGFLLPLGFLMGFPLPLVIRWLKERGEEHLIPWMWGINGAASVLGSVIAIVVATKAGLTQALLFGAGAYLVCAITSFITRGAPAAATGSSSAVPSSHVLAHSKRGVIAD